MMRSSILGTSTMLNVLIQHLPLQSLSWTKIWRAFQASDPSSTNLSDRLWFDSCAYPNSYMVTNDEKIPYKSSYVLHAGI